MAAQVITENTTGTQDGYDYELWKDNGNTTMTLDGGGTFSCQWSNINNALFRKGKKFDSTQTYQQIGNISTDYGCDYNPSGNSYLCVYGWTKSPLVEYYIVDSWGTWRPPGATSKGTVTIDGGTYEIYETTRVNQPSIEGDTTFQQYWSVRTSKRTSGTISVSEHFKAWERMGMQVGKLYEVALNVEGYQSSGRANVYKNDMTIGGASSGGGTTEPTGEWRNTADISWIDPSKSVVAFAFDDGPIDYGSSASKILDVMENNNQHCTFFYWGEKINNNNQSEIRRAHQIGCEVANHTYTHPYLTNMSQQQIEQEIGRTNAILKGITGQDAHIVRPPYLATNQTVLNAVNAPLITCDVDSQDWNGASKDQIISNVLNNVSDGSILLMHENYDATAQAVEYLVPELMRRGYVIVSVSELAKIKNANISRGHVYSKITGRNITTAYHGGGTDIPSDEPAIGSIMQCEEMTIDGPYAGTISSPFSGVALYGNNDRCHYTQYFTHSTDDFALKACSNNNNMARVDLKIGGEYKGTFYYGDNYPAVYTLENVSHGTGNQEVELIVTADDGQWDAYIDYLSIPTQKEAATPEPEQPEVPQTEKLIQCENMKISGPYVGGIQSPFSGIVLYGNDDCCQYTVHFTEGTNSFSLCGCSNNDQMARVDLKIGGEYKGTFYFGDANPAVYTIDHVTHGIGDQTVELIITADNGQWDAYVDYLSIS